MTIESDASGGLCALNEDLRIAIESGDGHLLAVNISGMVDAMVCRIAIADTDYAALADDTEGEFAAYVGNDAPFGIANRHIDDSHIAAIGGNLHPVGLRAQCCGLAGSFDDVGLDQLAVAITLGYDLAGMVDCRPF